MGYFDIQVNGYAGVDFNQDDLGAEAIHHACERLRSDGVDGILATIVTESPEKMVSRLERLVGLRDADPLVKEVVEGLHVEGPFINPGDGYRGAHPADSICAASESLCGRLIDAGAGLVRIFTLAPEQDPGCIVTSFLAERGIVVSAGHTDASLEGLRRGIDAGLGMMTHLGNGCPQRLPRHDNIIQRALFLRKHLWLSFIADGVHIPFPALRNYLDLAMPGGKCLVTTDCMAAAGLGPGIHRLSRWTVVVKEDLAAWAPDGSHLLGSAMSMNQAVRNLSLEIGLEESTTSHLVSRSPRESVGLS